eukprot:6183907-Pleurochrysis_carterae.AAC.2
MRAALEKLHSEGWALQSFARLSWDEGMKGKRALSLASRRARRAGATTNGAPARRACSAAARTLALVHMDVQVCAH